MKKQQANAGGAGQGTDPQPARSPEVAAPPPPSSTSGTPAFFRWFLSSTVRQVLSSSVMSIQSVLGWTDVTVRISLPDRCGRLRVVIEEGPYRDPGRARAARRRTTYKEGEVLRIALPGEPRSVHVFLPILTDARPIGVLEAIAPEPVVTECWRKLLRSERQAGRLLADALAEAQREAEFRAFPMGSLARDMVRAGSAGPRRRRNRARLRAARGERAARAELRPTAARGARIHLGDVLRIGEYPGGQGQERQLLR